MRARRGGLACGDDGLAPQRVDHRRGTVAVERRAKPVGEPVGGLELDDGIGTELARALEARRIATGGDDALCSEQTRSLDGDRPRCSGRTQHEYAVARPDAFAERQRAPRDDSRDAERDRDVVRDAVDDVEQPLRRNRRLLGERSVTRDAEAVAEGVDAFAVGALGNHLRARDVRKRRVAAVEPSRGDREVERIQSDGATADQLAVAGRGLGNVVDARRRSELVDARRAHGYSFAVSASSSVSCTVKWRSSPEISSARRVSSPGDASRNARRFGRRVRASIRTPNPVESMNVTRERSITSRSGLRPAWSSRASRTVCAL
jgi:hypothetical protein